MTLYLDPGNSTRPSRRAAVSTTVTADCRDPVHDDYAHLEGLEPFSTGTPDYDRFQAELKGLIEADPADVPDSLYRGITDDPGHDRCPRAVSRLIESDGRAFVAFLDCRSRTCSYCKGAIDERDAARIAYSLRGAEQLFRGNVGRELWPSIRKRAQRAGAVAIKMQSADDPDRIEVISSAPVSIDAAPAEMGEVVEMVQHRPPWAPGRSQTSGPGLVTIAEFEEITSGGSGARSVELHHSVTVDDTILVAEALRIPVEVPAAGLVWLDAGWDDPRLVAFRVWAADPNGNETWDAMRWETEVAQGVWEEEEPPVDAE